MMTHRSISILVAVGILLVGVAGCQNSYRESSAQVVQLELRGQYLEAATLASGTAEANRTSELNRVIYLLEAARTMQIAGEVGESDRYYAAAFEIIRPYLDQKAENRVTEAVSTTLLNQTLEEYKGTVVERIMLSTFQALNKIALGDYASARVELNRARDWQQDAVARAKAQIEKAQKDLKAEARKNDLPGRTLEVPSELKRAYSGLADLEGYADWRNPFASWLRGIFLLANANDDGDLGNARFDLRDVVAMNPKTASLVDPDLEAIESLRLQPRTWVVFMSGLAPDLEQLRLDIPIPVGNVNYVAAAFPILKPRPAGVSGLRIADGEDAVEGVLLANVDAMVAADYEKRIGVIVGQEILSAALKTTATWAASQAAGDYAGFAQLGGILYQALSTSADLRSWKTLPQSIYAAGIPTPASGTLTVHSSTGRLLATPEVDPEGFNLVTIILPSSAAPNAAVQSLRLDPGPRTAPTTTDGSSSG